MENRIIVVDENELIPVFGEVHLVYKRKTRKKMSELPLVTCSADSFSILCANWPNERLDLKEEMKVLFLNRSNRVTGYYVVSTGSTIATVVDIKLILIAALRVGAVNIILAHNHPSGSLRPSSADQEVTKKIQAACSYMDIQVLDHLIITSEGYNSMADAGLL